MPIRCRTDATPSPALQLMLACGVTGFRQMGGSRTLLDDRSTGKLALPIDGPALLSMPGEVLLPFNAGSESVALQSVRQQAEAGADFIKVAMVTPQVFFPAQAEAARLGLTTVGHLPVGIDVRAASDGRMRSIEHLGPGVGIVAACCDHQDAIEQAVADRPAPKFPTVPRLPFAERLMEILMARVMAKIVINPLLLAKPVDAELIADADRSFNDDKARALARVFAADQTWQCPTLIRLRTQQFCDDPVYRDQPQQPLRIEADSEELAKGHREICLASGDDAQRLSQPLRPAAGHGAHLRRRGRQDDGRQRCQRIRLGDTRIRIA